MNNSPARGIKTSAGRKNMVVASVMPSRGFYSVMCDMRLLPTPILKLESQIWATWVEVWLGQVDDCHEATSEKEIQALAAVTGTALKAPPNLISSLNNGDGGG